MDIAASTTNSLKLSWPALQNARTGYSPILSYELQIQNGFLWVSVKGQNGALDTSTVFTVNGLNENTYYYFRVRAFNVHGWSIFSNEFSSLTSMRPSKPSTIVTTLINLSIRVSWAAPFDNY